MQQHPSCYREFWPVYVRAHRCLATQRVHLFATSAGAVISIWGVIEGAPLLLPLGITVGYLIALASHRLVEGNWPTAGQHPFWSAVADIQMCAFLVRGRMGAEMRRLEVPRRVPSVDAESTPVPAN
jgi:hypothetical protein